MIPSTISNSARFEAAIARFDAENAQDPRKEQVKGGEVPKEVLYAQRMTEWLEKLEPEASEVLQLAVRCQHIRRWEIPRDSYPEGRAGYHQWRRRLYEFHAETAGRILEETGYDAGTIERVQKLLRKEELKKDPEVQALEDTACLVFLEYYFEDFAAEHDDEKLTKIVRKVLKKMSSRGEEAAKSIPLSSRLQRIVARALQGR